MAPLPPPPPPPPPPVQLFPAWALGNVAETEETGRYRILLDNPYSQLRALPMIGDFVYGFF
jgi:hypothetical protein